MRAVAQRVAHGVFRAGDKVGVHVLPAHYYSPVASRKQLHRTEDLWRRPLNPMPFDWDVDAQAEWLVTTAGDYPAELPIETMLRESEQVGGFRYGPLEAQFLYSYVRRNAPKTLLELGSGSSTLVMSRAVERNVAEGRPATSIIACDPYTAGRVTGLPYVTARSIGGLDLNDEVLALGDGDVLFIDSTHAVRTGSELAHLYLELLPQLNDGVVVHIHDIYLPYLFGPDLFETMFDWQETTLVAALLAGNPSIGILAAMAGVFDARKDALFSTFPEFRPRQLERGIGGRPTDHYPSSLWLQIRRT